MVSGIISCQRNGSDSAVRLYEAPSTDYALTVDS